MDDNSIDKDPTINATGKLGDIKRSLLDPHHFYMHHTDEDWVPMDGRSIVGTDLAAVIGENVPEQPFEWVDGVNGYRVKVYFYVRVTKE